MSKSVPESCFTSFVTPDIASLIPAELNDPFELEPPAIAKIAAKELQDYLLKHQDAWQHNFGFEKDNDPSAKGKMFGVLVVENAKGELGYLSTYSGKITDDPHPKIFVPSLFDLASDDHFVPKGMIALGVIGAQIRSLEAENKAEKLAEIKQLKTDRKNKSIRLQQHLFDQYVFLNKAGETKNIFSIFEEYANKKPPSGAGECAAPKLFQYAYEHKMKPIAIAEFWWGKSPRPIEKKHLAFYPACEGKCRPILSYML